MRHLVSRKPTAAQVVQIVLVAVLFLIALGVRWSLRGFVSHDLRKNNLSLLAWADYLRVHGFSGLGDNFAVYNPPYLYVLWAVSHTGQHIVLAVKTVSFAFDIVLAVGAALLTRRLRPDRGWWTPAVIGVITLYLPVVFLNSGMWGQSDSIYGAAIIWALWAMVGNRHLLTWSFFAIGFAFKAQIAFAAPALVAWWLCTLVTSIDVRRTVPWRAVLAPLVVPVIFLIGLLPAWIAGRPMGDLLRIYIDQANLEPHLNMAAPNMWNFFNNDRFEMMKHVGILLGLAAAIAVIAIGVRVQSVPGRSPQQTSRFWAQLTLLSSLWLPFVLPMMHERYFYMSSVLMLVAATVSRPIVAAAVVLSQLVQMVTYLSYLENSRPFPPPYLSVGMLLAIVAVSWEAYRQVTTDVLDTDAGGALSHRRTPDGVPARSHEGPLPSAATTGSRR
ncbi:hypothetical protein [Allobranchiibius sp. CTAmp26]|uniref:hypothetical protein n=1 Tax=Allobranchiibius sp. CTAmp26 TaxID=2815214 RepID=UPI001AA10D90|nr:hypothetical protein [Allobranchiibius sp. CTAmp26]MBO1756302.1 hypothetical protein [Allobranchiibius sp. CTAmp26]